MRAGVLPACGGGREGDPRHLYSPLPGRVPATRVEDPPPDLPRSTTHRQGNQSINQIINQSINHSEISCMVGSTYISASCGVRKLACMKIVCACMNRKLHGVFPEPKMLFYVKAILYSHWLICHVTPESKILL